MTNNISQLISDAKEIGFVSSVIGKSAESYHTHRRDLFQYLWMCEFKIWLIINHNIDVQVIHWNNVGYLYSVKERPHNGNQYDVSDNYHNINKAFATALNKAIIHLKSK